MKTAVLLVLIATTPGCQMDTGDGVQDSQSVGVTAAATSFPAKLRVIDDGFPNPGDPCRGLGETPALVNYLDHDEKLLGCPTRADADDLGGTIVGHVGGITLISVRWPGP